MDVYLSLSLVAFLSAFVTYQLTKPPKPKNNCRGCGKPDLLSLCDSCWEYRNGYNDGMAGKRPRFKFFVE